MDRRHVRIGHVRDQADAGGEECRVIGRAMDAPGEIGVERAALPLSALDSDIKWIIANHKDVAPRQRGVKYAPITPQLRRGTRILVTAPLPPRLTLNRWPVYLWRRLWEIRPYDQAGKQTYPHSDRR